MIFIISFWEETLFQCKWWSVYFTRHAIWSSTGIGAGSCPFFIIHSTMSFVRTTLDFTFTQNHEFPCSQGKQWRIQLLYRYKRAKTSWITVLNIRKLYLYFVYFNEPYKENNYLFILKRIKDHLKSVFSILWRLKKSCKMFACIDV